MEKYIPSRKWIENMAEMTDGLSPVSQWRVPVANRPSTDPPADVHAFVPDVDRVDNEGGGGDFIMLLSSFKKYK